MYSTAVQVTVHLGHFPRVQDDGRSIGQIVNVRAYLVQYMDRRSDRQERRRTRRAMMRAALCLGLRGGVGRAVREGGRRKTGWKGRVGGLSGMEVKS